MKSVQKVRLNVNSPLMSTSDSFVAYELDENKTLGENGYIYFLNASGYQQAVSGDANCNVNGATTEDNFTSRGCSVPMTLDGVNYRTLLLVNGRVPGPTIIVYEGQTVIIHVFNHLTDVGVTIPPSCSFCPTPLN